MKKSAKSDCRFGILVKNYIGLYTFGLPKFTDCHARKLSEVLHFGALSRAPDAQPAKYEYTSYADGPISPSHSICTPWTDP